MRSATSSASLPVLLLIGLAAAAPAPAWGQDHLVLTPSAGSAPAGAWHTTEVQVVDETGAPVAAAVDFALLAAGSAGGVPVFFSTGFADVTGRTDAATGAATVSVRDTRMERVTVSVQSASLSGTPLPAVAAHVAAVWDVTAGPAHHVVIEGAGQVRAGEEASFWVQVSDAYGNPTEGATPVCVTATGDAGGSPVLNPDDGDADLSRSCLTTDLASGWAPLTVSDSRAETVTLCATSTGLPGSGACESSTSLLVTGGDPHHLRLTTPASALACSVAPVALQVVDAGGNAVPGAFSVTLQVAAGQGTPGVATTKLTGVDPGTLPAASVTGQTRADGSASLGVTLDAAAVLAVSWTAAALPGDPTAYGASVAFSPGPADSATSTFAADTPRITAGAGAAVLTVQPKDACGVDLGSGREDVFVRVADGSFGVVSPEPAEGLGDGRYRATFTVPDGSCPTEPAVLEAEVGGTVLDTAVEITAVCQVPAPGSPLEVLDPSVLACVGGHPGAPDGVFARVQVRPVDPDGHPLPEGSVLTLVDPPAGVVLSAVESGTDPTTGAPILTASVGAERCGWQAAGQRVAPTALGFALDGVALTTPALVTFACPELAQGGVVFTAAPARVAADGVAASQITVSLTDVCGNPVFGRPVSLAATPDGLPIVLPDFASLPLTADARGEPTDGTVRISVRSEAAGYTGVRAEIGFAEQTPATQVVDSAPDLLLFTPEEVLVLAYGADAQVGVAGQEIALSLTVTNLTEFSAGSIRVTPDAEGLTWTDVLEGPAGLVDGVLVLEGPLAGGETVDLRLVARLSAKEGRARGRALARYVSELLPEATLEVASEPVEIEIAGQLVPTGVECGSAGGASGAPWLLVALLGLAATATRRRRP